jgi:DNA-directed RNA polymerase specialized sigma24 family protein
MPQVVNATPASYEELFAMYGDYVAGLVRKQLGPAGAQDAEDVAQEILLAEFRQGVLEMYNPEHTVTHQGTVKKCTFRAFLSARVVTRCMGFRDKISRRTGRELLIADGAVDESGTRWIELFGGAAWDDYSELDAGEFIARMRSYLATVPRRSVLDKCDLVALFDELVAQVRETGEVTVARTGSRFGVSDATITAWLTRLRQLMSGAGELPPPEKHEIGGVPLSLPDIRHAIEILKSAKGIMVKQPLAAAGHPLSGAEEGWYHAFSKQEIRLYPELRIDPQTHKKPAGHVKLAVIHRLERMLGMGMAEAEAPAEVPAESGPAAGSQGSGSDVRAHVSPLAAEPDPEPTVLELIESRLFRFGVPPAGVDEILALCGQLEPASC